MATDVMSDLFFLQMSLHTIDDDMREAIGSLLNSEISRLVDDPTASSTVAIFAKKEKRQTSFYVRFADAICLCAYTVEKRELRRLGRALKAPDPQLLTQLVDVFKVVAPGGEALLNPQPALTLEVSQEASAPAAVFSAPQEVVDFSGQVAALPHDVQGAYIHALTRLAEPARGNICDPWPALQEALGRIKAVLGGEWDKDVYKEWQDNQSCYWMVTLSQGKPFCLVTDISSTIPITVLHAGSKKSTINILRQYKELTGRYLDRTLLGRVRRSVQKGYYRVSGAFVRPTSSRWCDVRAASPAASEIP